MGPYFDTVETGQLGDFQSLLSLAAGFVGSACYLLWVSQGRPRRIEDQAPEHTPPTPWVAALSLAPIVLAYSLLRSCENFYAFWWWIGSAFAVALGAYLISTRLKYSRPLVRSGDKEETENLVLLYILYILRVCATSTLVFVVVLFAAVLANYAAKFKKIVVAPPEMNISAGLSDRFLVSGCTCRAVPRFEIVDDDEHVVEDSRDGKFENGMYLAPTFVAERRRVLVRVKTSSTLDGKGYASVLLWPDPPGVRRDTSRIPLPGGRQGFVDLIVLSQDDTWQFGSHEYLKGGRLPAAVLDTPDFRVLLNSYDTVVAVGTASHEGRGEIENPRAGTRASTIGSLACRLRRSDGKSRKVLGLNLGRFERPEDLDVDKEQSATERRVILFGVIGDGISTDPLPAIKSLVARKARDGDSEIFKLIAGSYPEENWSIDRVC